MGVEKESMKIKKLTWYIAVRWSEEMRRIRRRRWGGGGGEGGVDANNIVKTRYEGKCVNWPG